MLYTILQIIAFQALFLLVYDLFLKRETFFNYNRLYLMATSVLSLVLPFVKLAELQRITTKDMVIQLPEVFIGTIVPSDYEVLVAAQSGIIIEQPQTPVWQIVLYIGIAVAALFFMLKISKLYWLKRVNPKRWKGNVLIVQLIKSSAAFSFFNTIFLGDRISESEKITIYKHELVHVKQWHTLDLLVFEILRIAFWFNPLIYIYQNRIKELHEYIADAKAVKQNGKSEYYQSLLNQIFDVNNISFTNTFFKKSLIKKRIKMLQKSRSKQINLIKYTVLIPVVLSMLIYTSTEVRAQEKNENQETAISKELIKKDDSYRKIIITNGQSQSTLQIDSVVVSPNKPNAITKEIESVEIPFSIIEEVPTTTNCKDLLTNAERKRCMSDFIAKHVNSKFNKGIADSLKLDGRQRIFVSFKIDKKGLVKDVRARASRQELEDEAIRVIKTLPQFIPGRQKGNLVTVPYSLPIVFQITEDNTVDPTTPNYKRFIQNLPKKDSTNLQEISFSVIETAPIHPECKNIKIEAERKKCTSQAVAAFVNLNFNKDLPKTLDLSDGKQRIFLGFTIDKRGLVKSIKVRSPHEKLDGEATRVISLLPQFIPGEYNNKKVDVTYSLPIVFQIVNDEKNKI
ncbi:M56 family metallopeptidase [uncultured Winogradskyella sp.]|uniref:M56 family metallopeptidase n=1 Tax=uncultured Winogradskyella sp. TaxID=395353 RepID=UPI002627CC76|nr:M56 family metallopeptidase [uncultured Winogradskyella sp.]